MQAMTVIAGVAGSAAVTEVDEPPETDGPMLVLDAGSRHLRDRHRDLRRPLRDRAPG